MGVGRRYRPTTSFAILLTLLFSLMGGVVAHAQVTGATLSGTVTDPSGGVVVGAQVSAKDAATGVTKEATSDSAGYIRSRIWRLARMKCGLQQPGFPRQCRPIFNSQSASNSN